MYIIIFCLTISLLSSPASVYCSRRAAWVHICFSLITYYCIIDGDTLYVALERTCKRDNDFSLLVVFVCLLQRWYLIHLGHFVIYVSEIIQQYKLLTTCPFYHTICRLFSRYLVKDQHEQLWASMQSANFEYHDVRILIKSIGNGLETGKERHETFSSICVLFCTRYIAYIPQHPISEYLWCCRKNNKVILAA